MPPQENQPQSIPKSPSASSSSADKKATEDVPKDEPVNEEPVADLIVEKEPPPKEAPLSDSQPPVDSAGQPQSEPETESPPTPSLPSTDATLGVSDNEETKISQPSFAPSTELRRASHQTHADNQNFIQKLLIKAQAKIQERKQKKLDKIMDMFEANPKITNQDIQKSIRTTRTSAFRYLEILEKQNKIKQVGNTGKAVFYSKI